MMRETTRLGSEVRLDVASLAKTFESLMENCAMRRLQKEWDSKYIHVGQCEGIMRLPI